MSCLNVSEDNMRAFVGVETFIFVEYDGFPCYHLCDIKKITGECCFKNSKCCNPHGRTDNKKGYWKIIPRIYKSDNRSEFEKEIASLLLG